MSDEVRITYDVKELLGRIDLRLESIDSKLSGKADLGLVLALQEKVERLERRLEERATLESERARKGAESFTRREKLIGLLIAAAAVLAQPLQRIFHF